MKNKKGEIATLLTLGLVVLGTLLTLGSSLFINNQKTNLASNSRAATVYQCCKTYGVNLYDCSGTGKSKVLNIGNNFESACSLNMGSQDCSSISGAPTTPNTFKCLDLSGGGGGTANSSGGSGTLCSGTGYTCRTNDCIAGEIEVTTRQCSGSRPCCYKGSVVPTVPTNTGKLNGPCYATGSRCDTGLQCVGAKCVVIPNYTAPPNSGSQTNGDGTLIGSIGGCCFGYKQNTAAHTCASGQKYVRQYASASYMQTVADKPCTTAAYNSAYNAEWFDCAKIPNYTGTFNGDGCYPPTGSEEATGGKGQPCKVVNFSTGTGKSVYGCDPGFKCSNPDSSTGVCIVDNNLGIVSNCNCVFGEKTGYYGPGLCGPNKTRKPSTINCSPIPALFSCAQLNHDQCVEIAASCSWEGTICSPKSGTPAAGGGTTAGEGGTTYIANKLCKPTVASIKVGSATIEVAKPDEVLHGYSKACHVQIPTDNDNITVFRECPSTNCVYACFNGSTEVNCLNVNDYKPGITSYYIIRNDRDSSVNVVVSQTNNPNNIFDESIGPHVTTAVQYMPFGYMGEITVSIDEGNGSIKQLGVFKPLGGVLIIIK
ncbi:MAG: hypothetical protein WC744_01890 [Patescibacteria group bacterium]|jgi:hypothetical protein